MSDGAAERRFFSSMALALLVLVVYGFAPSYYLRGHVPSRIATYLDDPPQAIRPLFLIHGALFTSWFVLLFVQSLLVASSRAGLHRRLGTIAVALVPVIVGANALVIGYTVHHGFHDTQRPALQLAWFPICLTVWFGGFATAGLLLRARPQAHKRLLLLASIGATAPAASRVLWLRHPDAPPSWWGWLIVMLPLALWDLATRRRLHPATLVGAVALALVLAVAHCAR